MSGPITDADAPPAVAVSQDPPAGDAVQILGSRQAEVGGVQVRRLLPRRLRRSVGAWCFLDHLGPARVNPPGGFDVGPHPHIGLQTVTWLVQGAVLHRDSLGSEQLIRPGQLNLMSAGHGVAHSEETTGVYRGELHGVQLWIAQPSATRDGPAAFEHHEDLPRVELADTAATVLVGSFAGAISPARRDSGHMAVELEVGLGRSIVPLDASYEHAVAVLDGRVVVAGQPLTPGRLAYLGVGRDELVLETGTAARLILLGGIPFPEPLVMWWNYVARSRDEITAAHRDWSGATGRFGTVASPLSRIETAGPPWADPAA